MASRWRVWDNEAHINRTDRSNGVTTLPVKHTVGRGNLHLLAEQVSLPQLDTVKRSPGSRSKPPPRGMGRADILRNRLSRQNEVTKRPGGKVSCNCITCPVHLPAAGNVKHTEWLPGHL